MHYWHRRMNASLQPQPSSNISPVQVPLVRLSLLQNILFQAGVYNCRKPGNRPIIDNATTYWTFCTAQFDFASTQIIFALVYFF